MAADRRGPRRLLVAFVLVGFAVLGGDAFDGSASTATRVGISVVGAGAPSRGSPTAAPASAPLAAGPSASPSPPAASRRGFVGQSLGLLGFDLGFGFDVERLVVVIGFLDLRREGGSLRHQQRLGGFQRVHLFAAVDDERLLAGHGRIGDDRER